MLNESNAGVEVSGDASARANQVASVALKNIYRFEAYDSEGNLKWVEEVGNLVTNEGLNDALDKYLKGSAYTAAFYVGLTDASPTAAAGDTMSSHAGWAEFTTYDESTRETLTLGTVSSQSVDNSASKASFTITTASPDSQSIGGAFVTTNSTKGGTTGTLYSIAAFSGGNKTLNGGDTLNVTVTCTAAAS